MNLRLRAMPFAVGFAVCLVLASCSDSSSDSSSTTSSAAATPTSDAPPAITPVTASVLVAPIPVKATDNKIHMAYELILSNVMPSEVTIRSVKATANGRTLQELSGDELTSWMRVYAAPQPTTVLAPGQGGFVVIDATVDTEGDVPDVIEHEIALDVTVPMPPLVPASLVEKVAPTPVNRVEVVKIAPPLDGPRWLNGDGCCIMSAHRGALNPINGQLHAAERFAIDYVQLEESGVLFTGDKAKVESYAYFGDEIHAVADGKVVAVVDDLPEQVPGEVREGLELAQYGGNHVVQDIGGGRYAFYAHMQPGDGVKVAVGDDLTTGQVVGLLGNTGNSDAPHLHFHIMDAVDPLAANGLPFEIANFDLESRLASGDVLDGLIDGKPATYADGVQAGTRTDELPLDLDVMTYKVEK